MDALYPPEPLYASEPLYPSGLSVVHTDGWFFVPVAVLTTYVIVATVLTFYVIYQRRATRIDRRRLKEFRDLVARLRSEHRSVHEATTTTALRSLQMERELESLRRELAQLTKLVASRQDATNQPTNQATSHGSSRVIHPESPAPVPAQPTTAAPRETHLRVFRATDVRPDSAAPSAVTAKATVKAIAPATAKAAVATKPPVNDEPDDLTSIWGIGPGNQQKLQEHGVFYLEQIAHWSEAEITRFNAILGFKGRIERERWVEQAQAQLHQREASGAA